VTSDTVTHVAPAVTEAFPELRFATVLVTGIRLPELRRVLRKREANDMNSLFARREIIERRVNCGIRFFDAAGFAFPLGDQLSSTHQRGFPEAPPLVSALIRCELLTGVLMGVQDADSLVGQVRLDCIGHRTECFEGMSGTVTCAVGEIVVRDDEGIVASQFQGPDRRTQVGMRTRSAMFYIFDVPGLGSGFDEAELSTSALLESCSEDVRCTRATRAD
jgi:hypothetical protein